MNNSLVFWLLVAFGVGLIWTGVDSVFLNRKPKELFVIHWRSRITGYEGYGTTGFPQDQANLLILRANKEFIAIDHWKETQEND